MADIDIQRGKLVGQQGPGSLYIDTDGASYIISAVDKWYDRTVVNQYIDSTQLKIHDVRLEKALKVRNFLAIPDYRTTNNKENSSNTKLEIPINRFPLAEYCSKCGTFRTAKPTFIGTKRTCHYCKDRGEKVKQNFIQFPIIVICQRGHLEDFPYFRYVHATHPHVGDSSNARVWLERTGTSILNWTIHCSCGATHSLSGVTGRGGDKSTPYMNEMKGARCHGKTPWTGSKEESECEEKPIAILRNALNVYRPELVQALSFEDSLEVSGNITMQDIYSQEFMRLSGESKPATDDKLKVRKSFETKTESIIESVNFVDRLQELMVQTDFHRDNPSDEIESFDNATKADQPSMIFSKEYQTRDWYPAKVMYGEGIFIKFQTDILQRWSQNENVQTRFNKLQKRTADFYMGSRFKAPSDVLIHTLSHAMIKELSRHCGYPMTSIRERLYLEPGQEGLLLYVTDSDKAGTFGGLVRLAQESKFKSIFSAAIRNIDWCSSDPVCYELGDNPGQGLQHSNGSACHNCCFVPSTSCGYRNCYLDRDFVSRISSNVVISNQFHWFN